MKRFFQFFIALAAVLWAGMGMASQTRVVINLSEQKAYLIKQDKVILVSPISSGRRGCRHRRVISEFLARISTIGLGASGRSSMLPDE